MTPERYLPRTLPTAGTSAQVEETASASPSPGSSARTEQLPPKEFPAQPASSAEGPSESKVLPEDAPTGPQAETSGEADGGTRQDPEAGEHVPQAYLDVWVYIARDELGKALYVGVSGVGFRRLNEHHRRAAWAPQVRGFNIEHYPTRKDAERRERELIQMLRPTFNTKSKPRPRRSPEDLAVEEQLNQRGCLTDVQIAERVQLGIRFVQREMREGRLVGWCLASGMWATNEEDVAEWLRRGEPRPVPRGYLT